MESLYDKSIETFLKSVISNICLSRIVVALTEVSTIIDSSEDIPAALRPHVLLTALRILREIESDQQLLDQGYVEMIPHPRCGDTSCCLGEVWELPLGIRLVGPDESLVNLRSVLCGPLVPTSVLRDSQEGRLGVYKSQLCLFLLSAAVVYGAEEKKNEKRGLLGLGYGAPLLGHGLGLYGGHGLGLYGGHGISIASAPIISHSVALPAPIIDHGLIGGLGGHGLIGGPLLGLGHGWR
ncbi:unnamed protein product [Danaus chrysippus]|uniref:(African queen) hypothetical protein n=1 Tax=Danaus chrysippus TaxID=151541 RepID=A0A8J2R7K9_9NEOP|nr:unnamed protein product [Danaus chrysippus]